MNDSASGAAARRVAVDLLRRIDEAGAYANLIVPKALDSSDLPERDRALVTNLVYGTTRMRRACDWLVDRFVTRDLEPAVRTALRLGAYQLAFTEVPDHASVTTAVEVTPKRARGLVNAVLRRVATADTEWPDEATRLSYPDWILARLADDLGTAEAIAALERMNVAPSVTTRADGYVQDLGSQWIAEEVGQVSGATVLDCCAAPGGKATALAAAGALVVAGDLAPQRVRLIAANVARLAEADAAGDVLMVVADAKFAPLREARFDAVLVDAPCSGLGVLRRRADARWRIQPDAVARLAALQVDILESAARCVAPGGSLVYSVCTMTMAETVRVAEAVTLPGFSKSPLCHPQRWRKWSSGGLLLPQDHDTDGMAVFRWQRG